MGLEGLSRYIVTSILLITTKTIMNINIVSVHGHENCQSCHQMLIRVSVKHILYHIHQYLTAKIQFVFN